MRENSWRRFRRLKYTGIPNPCAGLCPSTLGTYIPMMPGALLDKLGIAVRTGHHCAEPLMERLGVSGTVRASFSAYNTFEEVDMLADGLRRAGKLLGQ